MPGALRILVDTHYLQLAGIHLTESVMFVRAGSWQPMFLHREARLLQFVQLQTGQLPEMSA